MNEHAVILVVIIVKAGGGDADGWRPLRSPSDLYDMNKAVSQGEWAVTLVPL